MSDSKRKLEANGIEYIVSLLRIDYPDVGQKIEDAWFEYERGVTREARYVREADKLECLAQAFTYEQETHGKKDLSEFQGLRSKIQSVRGVTWVDALSRKREDYFTKQKSQTPVIFVRSRCPGATCILVTNCGQTTPMVSIELRASLWRRSLDSSS
jgi:putative hydrolase of HD superfamily